MKKDDLNVWLVPAKKFQSMESQFDVVVEDLFNASIKLEEKEKVCKWELKGHSFKLKMYRYHCVVRSLHLRGN
jgi:hypothetical protein